MTYWLSYGGGVNSTALGVMLCEGMLPELTPWRCLWADTGDERPETYAYIDRVWRPYLERHGMELETVRDRESVLERWERLGVVGSRVLRACTDHAKIRPIAAHMAAHGAAGDRQVIGIDSGEVHRARPSNPGDRWQKVYPLVDLGIDRQGCAEIIRRAGLCVPAKSGCWHCPLARKRDVLNLARDRPDLMARIVELEEASMLTHPVDPGKVRAQWSERPAAEWLRIAQEESRQGRLFDLGSDPDDSPCGCYDGGGAQ